MLFSRTFHRLAIITLAMATLNLCSAPASRAGFLDDVGKVFDEAADQFSKDVNQLGKDLGIVDKKKKSAKETAPDKPKMRSAAPEKTPAPSKKEAKSPAPEPAGEASGNASSSGGGGSSSGGGGG